MPPSHRHDRLRTALLLGLVTLVPLALKLAWWARDTMLPYWDDAGYVEQALRMFDAAGQHGLRGLAGALLHGTAPREPLIAAQALPFLLLFGRSIASAQLVNAAWIVILALYLYRYCRLFWPRAVALAAVLTTAACPLLGEMGNAYLREYPLTALVVMTAYYLAASGGVRRRGPAVALGVLLGVGMLYRALYPLYVAGLYAAWGTGWRDARDAGGRAAWRDRARAAAIIAGVGASLCGPWYWINGGSLLRTMRQAAAGRIAQDYGSADVFSGPVIRAYLAEAARYGVSAWSLVLCGLGVAGCAVALRRRRLRWGELFSGRAALYLAGWAAPFLVFLFGVNKALRFITPLLPAFGIALAVLLWGASRAFRRAGVLAGAGVAAGFLILLWAQFGVGAGRPALNGAMQTLSGGIVVRRAEKNRWPYAEVIRFLRGVNPARKAADCSVMVLSDSVHFNIDLLQLWATLERQPFQIRSSVRLRYDEAGLRRLFEKADLVVARQGGEAELELKNPGPALLTEALSRQELTPLDCPLPLPDGGRLKVWRRK